MSFETDFSYDAVIPSAILFNDNLEPAAVKCYAMIKALSRMNGYCFATNAYLAEALKADESTVRRWLTSLTKEGYLEIETDKNGIHWQRRIYISDKFKKVLRRLKNEHPPAQKCAPPCSKMSTIYKENTKEDKDIIPSQAQALALLLKVNILKIKPDFKVANINGWVQSIMKMITIDKRCHKEITEVIRWLPSNEFWSMNVLSGEKLRKQFDRLQLEMRKTSNKTSGSDQILYDNLKSYVHTNNIQGVNFGPSYIEFEGVYDGAYVVGENGFAEKIYTRLRKMGLLDSFEKFRTQDSK